MAEDLIYKIENYPKVFYHGTDLRYISIPKETRSMLHSYYYGLREILYARFSHYIEIKDYEYTKLKELLGPVVEKEPKVFENLKKALINMLLSKTSESFEYGAFYLTSNIMSAYLYAIKSFAGGEFAFSAYAMAKAAKAIGHEDWYDVKELPGSPIIAEALITIADKTPRPVIFKITDVDPTLLRTEEDESIERYVQNGRLHHTEFRYNRDVDLSKYDYYVVDKDFKKKARAGELD